MNQQPPLISALERLFRWLEINASSFAQSFQPGLAREQIETQVKDLPFCPSEEVYQFYQWRNGGSIQVTVQGNSYATSIELLPIHRLLSLEEAIDEYRVFCEIYADRANNYHYLPLFADSANYYLAKGDIEPKATAAICYAGMFADQLELRFNDLSDLIGAIAECFEAGAYYFQGGAFFDWNNAREKQIWLKHQPQRAANVESLLNNQIQHFSRQELQQACSDLAISQHPKALSFFVQKYEETQAADERLRTIEEANQTELTLAEKLEAIESPPRVPSLEFRPLESIRMIDSIEAILYLFHLLKTGNATLQRKIIMQLNQLFGNRNIIYEAGQQDPEAIDRLRQMLQEFPGNEYVERLLERLESRLI